MHLDLREVFLFKKKTYVYYCSSGVPQGSNLAPLLYLLFINDIETVIGQSNFLFYADDLKIYRRVRAVDECVSL